MNLRSNSILLFILIITIVSCNQKNFIETKSGLKYKIVRKGNGEKFKNGYYVYLNMDYYDENDSMLFTYRDKGNPETSQYFDTLWDFRGQIFEGMKKLRVGDSAIFKVGCENLYHVTFRSSVPPELDPNGEITFYIGVENMTTPEQFRLWQANLYVKNQEEIEKKNAERLIEDLALIDEYLDIKAIIPFELESGLRYIVIQKGEGPKPVAGDKVRIHYSGNLIDGSYIDSSFDQDEPVEFILGIGSVIKGWEEGISQMNKGSKYVFYIPSTLAYGEEGLSDLIKPNAILIYEIELLEIEKRKE